MLNPYALNQDGKIVDISEVTAGLECNCRCIECNKPMVAKKGNINIHHFSHYQFDNCKGGFLKAIKMMICRLIEENKNFMIPSCKVHLNSKEFVVSDAKMIAIEKVETNVNFTDEYLSYTADLVVYSQNSPLIIELIENIENKHILEQLQISAIALKLPINAICINKTELEKILFNSMVGDNFKTWIFNKKIKQKILDIYTKYSQKIEFFPIPIIGKNGNEYISYVTMTCPLKKRFYNGSHYANVKLDCIKCKYKIDIIENSVESSILCGGFVINK